MACTRPASVRSTPSADALPLGPLGRSSIGRATDSDSVGRRFEPYRPSQYRNPPKGGFFVAGTAGYFHSQPGTRRPHPRQTGPRTRFASRERYLKAGSPFRGICVRIDRAAPRRRPPPPTQEPQLAANTLYQTTKMQENRAVEFKTKRYPAVFKGSCKKTTPPLFVIFLQKLLAFTSGRGYYSHCL